MITVNIEGGRGARKMYVKNPKKIEFWKQHAENMNGKFLSFEKITIKEV